MKHGVKLSSKPFIIISCMLGICLVLISGLFSAKDENKNDAADYYSVILENRVEELLLQMSDIETVSVFITLENSGETVYAKNNDANSSEYVIYSDKNGQTGLKLEEINPQVRGVAVVCNGGDNVNVQNKIISILSSALGIPTNRITVSG